MVLELTHVASFRDEVFPCLSVVESSGNALARTAYTHRDGQHIRNLGRLGSSWSVRAAFSPDFSGRGPYPDDLWPHGFFRFRDALLEKERGWFDHPMFGRAWAQASTWTVDTSNRHFETVFVQVEFQEANLDEPTYDLILGEDAVTEQAAESRAITLDSDLGGLYPDIPDLDPFLDAWAAFMFAMSATERVLNYDDAIVVVNVFHKTITSTILAYPLILDPVNWHMASSISLLRRDANTIASRIAGEGKRITTWDNKATRSALQISIALYNDATREEEFLKLNGKIKDPLFVLPGTYRVYSDLYPGSTERTA